MNKYITFSSAIKRHVQSVTIAIGIIIAVLSPSTLCAQVSILTNWTNVLNGTGNYSGTISIANGSNSSRILVVGIASDLTAAANTRTVSTITFGGQALTLAKGDMGSNTRQHTAFYYLTETGINSASGNSLIVNFSGGTTALNSVWYGVFENVNQLNPFSDSKNFNSGTTATNNISTGLSLNANDLGLKIISSVLTRSTTSRSLSSFGTSWTEVDEKTGSYDPNGPNNDLGIRNIIGNRNIFTAGTDDNATMSGNSLISMSAIALNYYLPKYFRSITSGNWNSTSTWQQSTDGNTWTAATSTPTSNDNAVIIRNGHNVTVTSGVSIDQTTIESGGQISVNSGINMTVSDGIGTDLTVNGNILNSGTITTNGTITFNSTSNYNHAQNGGTIPTATWNINSNCTITGCTTTAPNGLNQTFGNLIMDSERTTWVHFEPSSMVIQGNLEIRKTDNNNGNSYDFAIEQNLTIGGNLIITNGAYRLAYSANRIQTVNGNLILNGGTLLLNSSNSYASGVFTATLNVNGNTEISGGTLSLSGGNDSGDNGILNVNGNFTQSGGSITETGSSTASYINFTGNTVYTKTAGTISNTVNYSVASAATLNTGTSLINGSNGIFNLNSGANIITAHPQGLSTSAGTGSIQVSGTKTYNNGANYTYNGTALQVTGNGLTGANSLTINNSIGVTLSNAVNVSGVLNLQSGIVSTTGTNILTVTNPSTNAVIGGSATAYISGPFSRNLPSSTGGTANYIFPVGTGSYNNNSKYLPFTLNNPVTGAVTATVQAFAANAGGIASSDLETMSTTEYWQLTTGSNFTNSKISISRPNPVAPLNTIAGSTSQTGTYNNLNGSINTDGLNNSDLIGSNRFFRFAKVASTITVSKTSINTFSYVEGNGPSAIESLLINGIGLSGNVQVTAPQNFEISLTGGTGFTGSQVINIPAVSGQVSNTAVYIRMKAGLSQGAIPVDTLKASTPGMSTQNVVLSGNVTVRPVISFTPATLSGFNYKFASGPSTAQSFKVMGSNLSGNITLTAPANYEISLSVTTGYTNTLSVGSGQNVYVRLKTNRGVGSYNEVLTASSPNAETKQLQLNGYVGNAPTLTTSTSWLSGFIYTSGTTPAVEQSFILYGNNLGGNATITAPANFLISTTSNGTYGSSLTLTPTAGTINQTIFVRIATGLAVGTYGPSNIRLESTGAVVKTVALSGQVVNSGTILVSKASMSGLGYLVGNGPSGVQPLTVSGASLGGNITVSAPTNFEISANGTTGFGSTLTLTSASDRVNPTQVYIRLKAGLSANDYTQNLSVSASGATTRTINLNGKVYASPLISAAGGGDYCSGSTISLTSTGQDIMNRFWSGPNSFYSTVQNPTLNNSSAVMSGTYTVTGNVVVGGNLIVNGDFEMGNAAFGSSYGTPALPYNTSSLVPEGLYAVVDLPSQVHSNFSNTAVDKTTSPGTKQMVINGNTVPGVVVWTQSVAVIPNADYEFTYWVQSVVNGGDNNPSQLQLYVNGVAAGPVYTANTATGVWTQFIYNTNSGTNQILNLELINQNTIAGGNDFALDDIVFQQILSASASTQVSVNNSLPVSVSVNYSPNPVYENTPVTFTATPVNPGTSPVYNWTVNGNAAGTNSNTFTYTPQNGDVVRCELVSSYPCATGNPASDTKTMTVTKLNNYWMGSTNPTTGNNWGTPSNWTAGYVPLTGDNVEYATVANFGSAAVNDLQLDIDRTIGSLINATTRKLIIPAAKALTVNNSVITDGNPGRIIIKASSTLANGSLAFNNPQNMPVKATVEMYSPASWDLNQPEGLKYNWQYFGIPLRSTSAVASFTGSYVREKLESGTSMSNHWRQLNNESVLQPFIGYELCQSAPKIYTFSGELVNSNFNSGPLAVTTTAIYPGQHLFANPYTAAIDIRQINFGSSMEATVYMYNTGTFGQWNSSTGNKVGATPGQYVAVPRSQAGYSGVPRQVPSMNTMLVRALTADANAYVSFNYNETVMKNTDRQRVREERTDESIVGTMIEIKSENSSDKMWLFSDDSYTRGFDNGFDGRKIEGIALNPQIYAVEMDGNYQINAVDNFHNTQLAFRAGQDTEYKLEFTHTNIDAKYGKLFLHDMVTNKVTDITESGSFYSFTSVSTPSAVNRFRIVTQPVSEDIDNSNIAIFNSQNTIYVRNTGSEYGKAAVYDIAGRLIGVQNIAPASVNAFNIAYHEAYIVKVEMPTDNVIKKLAISK